MKLEGFWADLQKEVSTRSFDQHPIYTEMAVGRLKRASIAEMMAQIKHCVTDGITSLALILPQVPRPLKAELAANLYGEITGTPEVPSHWELALRAGAAAGYSKEDIDSRPMLPETKVYPDTVSAYAIRGQWVEALSFITIGIEDLFPDWCLKTAKALREHYEFDDVGALYFDAHVGADEEHSATGWNAAIGYATTEEKRRNVRRAALEGRNMWWNMYSAAYEKGEGKQAPRLHFDG